MYPVIILLVAICIMMFCWIMPRTHNLCQQSYWFRPLNYGWSGVVLTCQPHLKLDDFLLLRNGEHQTLYRIIEIFVVSPEKHLSKVWVTFERRKSKELPISYNLKYELSQPAWKQRINAI